MFLCRHLANEISVVIFYNSRNSKCIHHQLLHHANSYGSIVIDYKNTISGGSSQSEYQRIREAANQNTREYEKCYPADEPYYFVHSPAGGYPLSLADADTRFIDFHSQDGAML